MTSIDVSHTLPGPEWDSFVRAQAGATGYALRGWVSTLAEIFRLDAYYLTARDSEGGVAGVLPLIRQNSLIFGDRLTSLPFVNYGGAVAVDFATRAALMSRAVEVARERAIDRIEIRDTAPPPPGWHARNDKATLRLQLPTSPDALFKAFGSKLRSQVRRAEREPYEIVAGGPERLDDFYPVFAAVMHELGTPVYPRRFFVEIASRLPEFCTILCIRRNGIAVAAAFLVAFNDTLEIPWAATVSAEKPKGTNMLLYAEVLKFAIAKGCSVFDFGRSTIDSGPYRFKLQWGAQPVQLHWAEWTAKEPRRNPGSSPLIERATALWARLPLGVANRLGPWISPSLPW